MIPVGLLNKQTDSWRLKASLYCNFTFSNSTHSSSCLSLSLSVHLSVNLFLSLSFNEPLSHSQYEPDIETHTYTHTAYRGWLHEEESHDDAQLQQYEEEGNDELSAGRHEARFLCADLLLAACQDPSDAVCLGSDRKHHQDLLMNCILNILQLYSGQLLSVLLHCCHCPHADILVRNTLHTGVKI